MAEFSTKSVSCIAVTGPTATGKTALAVALAQKFNGEIVSIDSRQVYRGMDIGSGKDLEEYGSIPYHLIDIADPKSETYHLGRFCADAFAAIGDIASRGKLPVLCGGTALYLAALLEGYKLPGGELPAREIGTPRIRQNPDGIPSFHPPFQLNVLLLGVLYPREVVRKRIALRLESRLAHGMVEEVQKLLADGVPYEKLEMFGLEYRELARYLKGEIDYDTMKTELLNRIRQFAKRQDIFFRKLERDGHPIYWLKEGKVPDPFQLTRNYLDGTPLPPVEFRLCDHLNAPSK